MLAGAGRLPPRPAAVPTPDPTVTTFGTRTRPTATARAIPAVSHLPPRAPAPRAQLTRGRGRGGKRGGAVERVGKPITMPTSASPVERVPVEKVEKVERVTTPRRYAHPRYANGYGLGAEFAMGGGGGESEDDDEEVMAMSDED
ncbi:hypothetical protein GGF32_002825 [Allomyces javanicus]|nr:hypothetical protein GGF32_002825 [Allomyces javanicus]